MQKALVACALLLTPLALRAQTTVTPAQNFPLTSPQTTTTPSQSTPEIYVGHDNCRSLKLTFNWDLTVPVGGTTLQSGQQVNVIRARSTGTCATLPENSANIVKPDDIRLAPTQSVIGTDTTLSAQDMILDTDAGMPNGCDNTTTTSSQPWTTFYCIQLSTSASGTGTNSTQINQPLQVNFAMVPPTPPAQLNIEEGDQHLKVFWSPGNSGENLLTYRVHVLAAGDTTIDDSRGTSINASQLNADVNSDDQGHTLVDDQPYTVFVVAHDAYGNISEPSLQVPATPIHVLDFYGLYRTDNGRAGGCGAAGPGTWAAMLALLVGLLVRRKKKARNAALLIAAVTAFAPKARAEGYQRPDRFLLVALKVDRYDPKIDSEPGLTSNPYHQVFGDRAPLRWQAEVDWEVWHPYGSILVGVTGGYWQNFGKGLKVDGTKSQDTALLDVIPLGLVATYRFDKLADMWQRFPVIPYAQIGLMRAFWVSYNGVGNVSPDTSGRGGRGQGWTLGYTTALGFALALDAIDPQLSREAFQDTGIQRSSIFAEYGWTKLDGFGNNKSLILSDHAWRFGVAMEF